MTIATATNNAVSVIVSENGQKGVKGIDGINGTGLNTVRKSLLDNPLCHLFKSNKIVETLAGTLTTNHATTSTYRDRYGVVKTAAIDTPREEKDGWLIEGSSTNLLLYSEDFSNAIWGKNTATVTANTSIAPDGTTTADRLVGNGADSYIIQNFTPTANTTTFSVWLRSDSPLTIKLSYSGIAAVPGDISLTSTWKRYTLIGTSINHVGVLIGGFNSISNTETVYIWGAQLEELSFASSYVPTTTAAATRSKDTYSLDYINNHPDSVSNYSFFSKFKIDVYDSFGVLIDFNDSFGALSGGLAIQVARNDLTFIVVDGRGTILQQPTPFSVGQIHDLAVVLQGTLGSIYVDGALHSTFTRGTATPTQPPTQTPTIGVGANGQSNSSFYGVIKDMRFYDFALNQEEVTYLSGV